MNEYEIIAEFMKFSKCGKVDLSHICIEEKSHFLGEVNYKESWDWLMPVFDKLTRDYDISWRISSTEVRTYNPQLNIDGRWEVNCPENIIVDAYRAVLSNIKLYY
jgi:hypothetical protein